MLDWFWYSLLIVATGGHLFWIFRFFNDNACVFINNGKPTMKNALRLANEVKKMGRIHEKIFER